MINELIQRFKIHLEEASFDKGRWAEATEGLSVNLSCSRHLWLTGWKKEQFRGRMKVEIIISMQK